MNIWVALYKGEGSTVNRLVRWWTKSKYSHAELVLTDKTTWVGISPFLKAEITKTSINTYNKEDWDFYNIPVTQEQYDVVISFYNLTEGATYDWFGMSLSQFLPFRIKQENKWYCSEWILYALRVANIIDWKVIKIFDQSDLSPSKLYDILELCGFKQCQLEEM